MIAVSLFIGLCILGASVQALDFNLQTRSDLCVKNSVTAVSCANVRSVDGFVPHPDDCHLFYYCVLSYLPPFCRQCVGDMHFNPVLHICDWPSRAGCSLEITTAKANTTLNDVVTETKSSTAWMQSNDTSTNSSLESETTTAYTLVSNGTTESASDNGTTTNYTTPEPSTQTSSNNSSGTSNHPTETTQPTSSSTTASPSTRTSPSSVSSPTTKDSWSWSTTPTTPLGKKEVLWKHLALILKS